MCMFVPHPATEEWLKIKDDPYSEGEQLQWAWLEQNYPQITKGTYTVQDIRWKLCEMREGAKKVRHSVPSLIDPDFEALQIKYKKDLKDEPEQE